VKWLKDEKQSIIKGVKAVIAGVITLAAIMGLYAKFNAYVDNRIDKKIQSEDFIKRVSQSIRPSVVFDQNSSILADAGAMAYIDCINVVLTSGKPTKIVVSPKVLLPVAPLLESLDGVFAIEVSKGKKYDWTYQLKGVTAILSAESGEIASFRFRIEIVR
jgi:hypothetical protein